MPPLLCPAMSQAGGELSCKMSSMERWLFMACALWCETGFSSSRHTICSAPSLVQGVALAPDGPLHLPEEGQVSAPSEDEEGAQRSTNGRLAGRMGRSGEAATWCWRGYRLMSLNPTLMGLSRSYSPEARSSTKRRSPSPKRKVEEKRAPEESERLKKLKQVYGDASSRDA